jgi:hypothetical protein
MTVQVDAQTGAFLEALPNRSAFIRAALRARLGRICPVCGGSGMRADGVEQTATVPAAKPGG